MHRLPLCCFPLLYCFALPGFALLCVAIRIGLYHDIVLLDFVWLCIASQSFVLQRSYKSGMGLKSGAEGSGGKTCLAQARTNTTIRKCNMLVVGPRRVVKGYADTQIWGPESPRHGTHQTIKLHQKVSTKHMCFSVESGPRRTETHAGAIRHPPSTVKPIKNLRPKRK